MDARRLSAGCCPLARSPPYRPWLPVMDYQVILKYFAAFATAALVTLLLTPLVRRLALAYGLVDMPDSRRVHTRPVPRLGGVAVFIGFHAAAAVVFLLPWTEFFGKLDLAWWLKFLLVSAFITGVGVVDDVRGIRPLVKLAGQIAAAVLAYAFNMRFGIALGIQLPAALDLAATVFWILAITNAFNLIDGMDGLAAGLALVAALGLAGGLLLRHLPADVLVLLGLMGACAGFLRYNFNPASIFLGDSGSMFLGFSLAVIALSSASKGAAMASIGVPLLAVGVPLFDTMLAIWRRFVRGLLAGSGAGRSAIMQADMEHLHHRLSKSGLSQRRVATVLYVLGVCLVGVALLGLVYQDYAVGIYLVAFVAGIYVVVRHLARVELWDSGSALLYGLRRPPGKVAAVLLYPVLDAVMLAGCLAAALWLTWPEKAATTFKYAWLHALPVWGGMSFIALCLVRTYQRVWSRARIGELLLLGAAMLLGVMVSVALTVMSGGIPNRDLVLQALIYCGLGLPLIVGMRMLSRTLQDVMAFSARHPSLAIYRDCHNTLVYGVGVRGMLFLRQRSAQYPGAGDRRRIVGILDDDTNLHGRWVYGYPVRGGVQQLEDLAQRHAVKEVVVAAALQPDALRKLCAVAHRKNLVLTEWRVEERPLAAHGCKTNLVM